MHEEGKQGLDEDRIIVQVHAVFWKCCTQWKGVHRESLLLMNDWEALLKGIHCKAVINYYIIITFLYE
jgi:hypothetical protein